MLPWTLPISVQRASYPHRRRVFQQQVRNRSGGLNCSRPKYIVLNQIVTYQIHIAT